MKKILLQIDQNSRDSICVQLIGKYLKEMGLSVAYCNKLNMLATAINYKPDVFVMSCTEGQYYDLATYLSPKCKIVLMTQEGACATKESTLLRHTMSGMNLKVFLKDLSRVYLWGGLSQQWLVEAGVYPSNIVRVFGSPRLDPYRVVGVDKKNINKNRIRVGIANRGASINSVERENLVQEVFDNRGLVGSHRAYLSNNREWEDWIWHSMACLRTTFELMDLLSKKECYEIIFRPDPYESSESYRFLERIYPNFHIDDGPALSSFISDIDVLITEFSTTGVEALICEKPVISFQALIGDRLYEHTNLKNHIEAIHTGLYWRPTSFDEFLECIDDAVSGKIPYSPCIESVKEYLSNFYGWSRTSQPSSYLIAQDLKDLSLEKTCKSPINIGASRVHPEIDRLSYKFNLPKIMIKYFYMKKSIVDAIAIFSALKKGKIKQHFRLHFYSWMKNNSREIDAIFKKLKSI